MAAQFAVPIAYEQRIDNHGADCVGNTTLARQLARDGRDCSRPLHGNRLVGLMRDGALKAAVRRSEFIRVRLWRVGLSAAVLRFLHCSVLQRCSTYYFWQCWQFWQFWQFILARCAFQFASSFTDYSPGSKS